MTSRYIAVDWGSTNFRAWLFEGRTLPRQPAVGGGDRPPERSIAGSGVSDTNPWLARGAYPGGHGGNGRQQRGLEERALFTASPPISRPLATS